MRQSSVSDAIPSPTTILIHALFLTAGILAGCNPPDFDPPIDCKACNEWNQPQVPFQIVPNTYYVGVAGLSSLLIDTGAGLVLLDGGLPQSAAMIDANIRALGFRTEDVDYILVSHVHYDHVGGVAALQRISGATVFTSRAGLGPLRRGMLADDDPQFSSDVDANRFPPSQGVHALDDRTVLTIGAVKLRANYTPGHTPGGISWSWQSCEDARCLSVVYADSLSPVSLEGFLFGAGPDNAASKLRNSSGIIASLDCDILLSPHPSYFDMQAKLAATGNANPFVDDSGCKSYAVSALAWLERRLADERKP